MVSFDVFKKMIALFEKNGIRYLVFGGFALDGIRGAITREHNDIDLYVFSDDLDKLLSQFRSDDFNRFKRKNMYFIEAADFKIGIVVLTYEHDKIIAHGNNTLVAFPKDIFTDTCIVSLNNVSFRIVPNEALVIDSKFSEHDSDRSFVAKLKYNKVLFDQIKIIKEISS